jgi:hypothetical protein
LCPRAAAADPRPHQAKQVYAADVTVEFDRIARALTSTRGVKFHRVVTVDFDRDGDIDVLAATDRGVFLWLNDGNGHLTAQRPHRTAGVSGRGPANTWRERREDSPESIQSDPPSLGDVVSDAHAPPTVVVALRLSADATLRDRSAGCLPSRAPPA